MKHFLRQRFIHAVYAKEAFGLEEYAACTAEGPCFHADSRDILVEFFPALPPRHLQDASAARARLRRASRAAKDDFCCFSPTCHPPVPETDPPVTSPVNQLCHSCPQLSPCHADGDRELSISTNHPSDRCKTFQILPTPVKNSATQDFLSHLVELSAIKSLLTAVRR